MGFGCWNGGRRGSRTPRGLPQFFGTGLLFSTRNFLDPVSVFVEASVLMMVRFGASQYLAGLASRPSVVSLHQTFFWWAILPMFSAVGPLFGFLVCIVAIWTSFSGFKMACMSFG